MSSPIKLSHGLTIYRRLQKLAQLASPPVCIPVLDYPDLEQWVHEGGRMLLVGQAAHPLPVSFNVLTTR